MPRSLLVFGATARPRSARTAPERGSWATNLPSRRPFKVAAVAMATRMARVAWALLVEGGPYRQAAAT